MANEKTQKTKDDELAQEKKDEMEKEIKKIKDEIQQWEERDKTPEYIKQMQQVEDEMESEYKKIKTEMENVIKAKERHDTGKDHNKNLENIKKEEKMKIEKQKKNYEIKIKNIKDETKSKKEEEEYNKIIKKINNEAKNKTEEEIIENEERLKRLCGKAKELNEEIDEAKKLKSEAHDVKETLKLRTENVKRILKEATEKDTILRIQAEVREFKIKRSRQWDEYYMKIACLAALRSKDPSTPVS